MSELYNLAAALAACNLHFCLYGGLGLGLLARAVLALRERRYDEAREHGVLGVVHIGLGLV